MPNEPHENGFRPLGKKPQIIISVAIISLVLVCFTLVNLHISRSSQTASERNEPVLVQEVPVLEFVSVNPTQITPVTDIARDSSRLDDLLDSIDRLTDLVMELVEQEMERAWALIEEDLERSWEIAEEELERAREELENTFRLLEEGLEVFERERVENNQNNRQVNWGGWSPDFSVLEGRVLSGDLVAHEFDNITSLYITTFDDSISFSTVDGDRLVVRYHEWIDYQYNISVSNGVLTITHNLPSCPQWGYSILRRYLQSNGQTRFPPMEIIIPEHFNIDDIHVRSTNAAVSTNELQIGGNLNVTTTNGAMAIRYSLIGGHVEMTSTNGAIAANNSIFGGTVDMRTTNGRANTARNQFNGEARIRTTNGAIRITECVFTELNVSTSRDSIHIELPDSAENYDIQFSGRGNITHNGRRVEASDLRNSNASRRIIASTSGNLVIESDR